MRSFFRCDASPIFQLLLGGLLFGLASVALAAPPNVEGMVKVRLATGLIEGRPVAWDSRDVLLLGRDGQLIAFPAAEAKEFKPAGPKFTSFSASEMRARLHAEFGREFDVTPSQHYLVVHPRGNNDPWAERFEEMYRSFYHYFQVRGFKLRESEFPLVAVVFPSKEAYQRYSAEHGSRVSPEYLGHYSSQNNRVFLFNTASKAGSTGETKQGAVGKGQDWSQNADTIIHEATHQTAYNTGVHSRYAVCPRWASEGLATMFEARGVWNSSRYRSVADRINQGRLREFKANLKGRPEAWFAALVRSDETFLAHERRAYAEAWALSFYLCETQPRLYAKYLAVTAEREAFTDYTSEQRLADFTGIFGDNLKQLDAMFLRYMANVK